MTVEGSAWIHPEELPDAFPAAPRVDSYVPRPSTEETLTYLEAKVAGGPGWYELSGPPGVGKTLLLRLLARRLAFCATPVAVPYPRLDPRDMARWILRVLEAPQGPSARASLMAQGSALADMGHPLVLLIDDGQLLPDDTAAWLSELTRDEARVRIVLAVSEGAPRSAAEADARAFAEPLSLQEVVAYVRAHLARVGVSEPLQALFEGERLQALALESQGNPRQIQRLADARIVRALRWTEGRARAARAPEPALRRATPSAPRERIIAAPSAPEPVRRPSPRPLLQIAAGAFAATLALAALLAAFEPLRPALAPTSRAAEDPAPWQGGVALRIDCDEPAEVALDGHWLGALPLAVMSVPPGSHSLAVRFDDGSRMDAAVDVRTERPWVRIAGRQVHLEAAPVQGPQSRR